MLTPPRSSAPRWSDAPDRMLPVCPGWMPTPVAFLLNRPLTTFSLGRNGASGWRVWLNSIAGPAPRAHHWSGLTLHAMNRVAKRFGHAAAAPPAAGWAPQTETDSSHGS